jgi:predicted DNA-binding WGR domain protein
VLHRVDPDLRMARFYSLLIERDLFGTVRLVRNWGRIGTNGQEFVEVFATEFEAGHGACVISLTLDKGCYTQGPGMRQAIEYVRVSTGW